MFLEIKKKKRFWRTAPVKSRMYVRCMPFTCPNGSNCFCKQLEIVAAGNGAIYVIDQKHIFVVFRWRTKKPVGVIYSSVRMDTSECTRRVCFDAPCLQDPARFIAFLFRVGLIHRFILIYNTVSGAPVFFYSVVVALERLGNLSEEAPQYHRIYHFLFYFTFCK